MRNSSKKAQISRITKQHVLVSAKLSTTGLLNGQCCGLYSKAVGPEDPSQVAATDLKTAQLAIC